MSDLSRNSINQIFSTKYLVNSTKYLVVTLWIIPAFWLGLFGIRKSALERLQWRDCLHENAEPGVDVDYSPATSWTWTTATSSILATSRSFVPFFSFWQLFLSTYHPLYTSNVFPDLFFISPFHFLFLSFSLFKKSFDLAFTFSHRNLLFWRLLNWNIYVFLVVLKG